MKLYILTAVLICLSPPWARGEWEDVVLGKVLIEQRSPNEALIDFMKVVSDSEAASRGFKGFVSCVAPNKDESSARKVFLDLKNVPLIKALNYVCESGGLKFRVINDIVYVHRVNSESLVIEISEKVRTSLDLAKTGEIQINSLNRALKLRGVEIFEDESRMVINDTAIVVVQECDAEYLKAIYEVAKRGFRIVDGVVE